MATLKINADKKPEILAALYNASQPLGMGILHFTPEDMTTAEAAELLKEQDYFDYLKGRIMKIDLSSDELRTGGYDRDNGEGAVQRVLEKLDLLEEIVVKEIVVKEIVVKNLENEFINICEEMDPSWDPSNEDICDLIYTSTFEMGVYGIDEDANNLHLGEEAELALKNDETEELSLSPIISWYNLKLLKNLLQTKGTKTSKAGILICIKNFKNGDYK